MPPANSRDVPEVKLVLIFALDIHVCKNTSYNAKLGRASKGCELVYRMITVRIAVRVEELDFIFYSFHFYSTLKRTSNPGSTTIRKMRHTMLGSLVGSGQPRFGKCDTPMLE